MTSAAPAGRPRVFDLRPAAGQLAALVTGLSDDDLARPTPCDVTVSALLTHVAGSTAAFTATARGEVDPADDGSPPGGMPDALPPGWREELPRRLAELAAAWREPAAWRGRARAGGLDLPAPEVAAIARDELVLHAWDLAVATGRTHEPDAGSLTVVAGFVAGVPADPAARRGTFGPPRDVPTRATPFERVLALAGRDPRWRP